MFLQGLYKDAHTGQWATLPSSRTAQEQTTLSPLCLPEERLSINHNHHGTTSGPASFTYKILQKIYILANMLKISKYLYKSGWGECQTNGERQNRTLSH